MVGQSLLFRRPSPHRNNPVVRHDVVTVEYQHQVVRTPAFVLWGAILDATKLPDAEALRMAKMRY